MSKRDNNIVSYVGFGFALFTAVLCVAANIGYFLSIFISCVAGLIAGIITYKILKARNESKIRKKEMAKLSAEQAERETFLKTVREGTFIFPHSDFYNRCSSEKCVTMSSAFSKEKAKLIADNILEKNGVPAEYYHLYDSEEKLQLYIKTAKQEKAEREAQRKKEAERIASIPHDADLTDEEREAIAIQDKAVTLNGKSKREYMLSSSNQKLLERINNIEEVRDSAIKLGIVIRQSAAKEKTTDWSIAGGIAEGLAGPAAGLAVAADVMRKNAEIEERNRQNQAAVDRMADNFTTSTLESLPDIAPLRRKSRNLEYEMKKLSEKVVLSDIDQSSIQNALKITDYSVSQCKSNALELTLEISNSLSVDNVPENVQLTTDGSFTGTIYAGDLLVGTVNIPLPVFGVGCGSKETVKAFCGKYSKNGKNYTVDFKPNNLWVMEK